MEKHDISVEWFRCEGASEREIENVALDEAINAVPWWKVKVIVKLSSDFDHVYNKRY